MKNKLSSWCRDCKNEQRRGIKYRNLYDLTVKEYDDLLESQDGVCAICGNIETALHSYTKTPLRLAVDHNSKTGKIRGLLCRKCNTFLVGNIENDLELTKQAIKYLEAERE